MNQIVPHSFSPTEQPARGLTNRRRFEVDRKQPAPKRLSRAQWCRRTAEGASPNDSSRAVRSVIPWPGRGWTQTDSVHGRRCPAPPRCPRLPIFLSHWSLLNIGKRSLSLHNDLNLWAKVGQLSGSSPQCVLGASLHRDVFERRDNSSESCPIGLEQRLRIDGNPRQGAVRLVHSHDDVCAALAGSQRHTDGE